MSKVRCPICDEAMPGNWADYPEYPFCSRRCKTIDLGRWLGEDYKVSSKDENRSTPGEPGSDHDSVR
ncbi:MAG TPA: DNA gyrase inhibitor YacG [Fimbriiglobus sp.]|jgi:endogenous inhibitor of DNA gyrase (YacG/DUF329 family)|nr:DNA gyrase inhibitor YacG [Fimbriiglobus sp.]